VNRRSVDLFRLEERQETIFRKVWGYAQPAKRKNSMPAIEL